MNVENSSLTRSLCRACQRFYGSEATQQLCSACYKKSAEEKPECTKVSAASELPTPTPELVVPPPMDRSRCSQCTRKVGMLGVECRCGKVFCNGHRQPEAHSCSFDFKGAGQTVLKKTIFKVENSKVEDI